MSIVIKPRITDYWEQSSETYETPIFNKLMSRDRFLYLKKTIIFYDFDNYNNNIDFYEVNELIR